MQQSVTEGRQPFLIGGGRTSPGGKKAPRGGARPAPRPAGGAGGRGRTGKENEGGGRRPVKEKNHPIGFDTLTLVGRSLFAVCRRLSHSGRVVPGVMSRSTEAAEGGTRDEVSLDVEDVVNGGVDGDEALG